MPEHDKETIRILVDFVEGKLNISAFRHQFDNNCSVRAVMQDDPLFFDKASQHIDYCMDAKQNDIINYLSTITKVQGDLRQAATSAAQILDSKLEIRPKRVAYEKEQYGIRL